MAALMTPSSCSTYWLSVCLSVVKAGECAECKLCMSDKHNLDKTTSLSVLRAD